MKRKSIAMLAAALCTLAITVTALAAELINAEQARSIAAQWVPAGSTHLVTKDESFEFVPHYDVKFYDNKTNTAYEIEVLRNGGKVREFKMEAQTALGSPKIVLSVNDVQNLVRKEFPNAVFTKVELDRGDGLYEYEADFYTPEVRLQWRQSVWFLTHSCLFRSTRHLCRLQKLSKWDRRFSLQLTAHLHSACTA